MDTRLTGRFIAERRKELSLNQKELAEKLNVTDKAVSKWETGRSAPDISMLEPLAEALGVTVAEILKGQKIEKEKLNEVSDEIIVQTMKKSRRRLITVILSVLLITFNAVCGYFIYHYAYSVKSDDTQGIIRMSDFAGIEGDESMEIIRAVRRGKYYAFLLKKPDHDEVHLRVFQADDIFKDRLVCTGGTSAQTGGIGQYSYGENHLNTDIFFGYGVKENEYFYNYRGAECVRPVTDGIVLDFMIEYNHSWTHASLIQE